MAKKPKGGGASAFSAREELAILKMETLYQYHFDRKRWRELLDEWHWWSSNWRKFPGYFMGKVAVLGFDTFIVNYSIAERGRPIYEKLSGCKTRAEYEKVMHEYRKKGQ